MSGSDVVHGISKRNRSVQIDSCVKILQSQPIAHARFRSVMDMPKNSKFFNQKACSVGDIAGVVEIMNEATNFAAYVAMQLEGVHLRYTWIRYTWINSGKSNNGKIQTGDKQNKTRCQASERR